MPNVQSPTASGRSSRIAAPALLAFALLVTPLRPAGAHGDEPHDHDQPAAAVASGSEGRSSGTLRLSASSDLFELVGIVDGTRLLLWLDRFADNRPVFDATVEVDVDGQAMKAALQGDVYSVNLAGTLRTGRLPVTVTILAGGDSDLLAAELEVPGRGSSEGEAPRAAGVPSWPARDLALAAGVALAASAVGFAVGRRRAASPGRRA